MHLSSRRMHLSSKERSWLKWFGTNSKFSLGLSCWLNQHTYPVVEQTFESIAATRVNILNTWVNNHWDHLALIASLIKQIDQAEYTKVLAKKCHELDDFSELFIIDTNNQLLGSSYAQRNGSAQQPKTAISQALIQNQFLHGPYTDPLTLKIGASSSTFHDEVTLMFYQTIKLSDTETILLCGRVPNDVIGDLIQREAGHIFHESGDNYLFMVDAQFDKSIEQGIALSRSRFEDNTFSHGENLKSGVNTGYGVVRINRHTEFEIKFTDPATQQLHPGVRETIKNGHNLFVTYPGYSDYRHIPVIGKGITFKLKGSLDTWGMMCEGDLEEVYRRRSINFSLIKLYLMMMVSLIGLNTSLFSFTDLSLIEISSITAVGALLSCFIFAALGSNKISNRLNEMTNVIRTIAEGEGNLTQRLAQNKIKNDETGDMSRWVNSFIDNLDGIVGQVLAAAGAVKSTNDEMLIRNQNALVSSTQVDHSMQEMQSLIDIQRHDILHASETANQMQAAMQAAVKKAINESENARASTQAIKHIVETTAQSVQQIDARMNEIGNITSVITEITNQTNLLALNAAIEAARAGEFGRGFSVVADEVRSLAGRTAEAATNIQVMIQSLQDQSQQAVSVMEIGVKDVDETLTFSASNQSENNTLHQTINEMFETIAKIEQNSANNAATVIEVAQVTDKMTQVIHDLNHSSIQVDNNANKLNQLVDVFTVSQE